MRARLSGWLVIFVFGFTGAVAGERRSNNLVSELLVASSVSKASRAFTFTRASEGWVFISASCEGRGTVRVVLDREDAVIVREGAGKGEAMRYVTKGTHTIRG